MGEREGQDACAGEGRERGFVVRREGTVYEGFEDWVGDGKRVEAAGMWSLEAIGRVLEVSRCDEMRFRLLSPVG